MLSRKKSKSKSKTTSTPVPVPRFQSPVQLNTTYTKAATVCSDGNSSSSHEQSQSPILLSPVLTQNRTPANKRKNKPKLPKVKIYHPNKPDKRKATKKATTSGTRAVPVSVSSEEAPLPKRRRVRENARGKRGRETEEGTAGQFPCKSVKVVGGAMIDLRVIYKSESAGWSKTGDINYSVGTVTEQFKWGLLEILGGGVKPTSMSKDWMVFHLMSGSVEIYLDSQLIGSLDKVGDTFLVPPESTYEFHNSDSRKALLTYVIIMQA